MSVLRATPKDRETAALLVPASRAVNDGLELIRTNRRRPATAPTTPSSAGKASPYPLLGERPLELGERSENTEEETSNPRFPYSASIRQGLPHQFQGASCVAIVPATTLSNNR
jgi:hypothetical protein